MPKIYKHLIPLITLAFILLASSYTFILHAESPLEKAQIDYSNRYSKSRDAYERYINSKSSYETFKTATSKNDAFIKTQEYLLSIDELYISYLTSLIETIHTLSWQNSEYKLDDINIVIEDEQKYFNNNSEVIKHATTLEQLPEIALGIDSHITSIANPKFYKILTTLEYTRASNIQIRFQQISQKLIEKTKSKNATQSSTLITNWQSEINLINSQSQNSLIKAKTLINKGGPDKNNEGTYSEVAVLTQDANNLAKRSINLFREILRFL